MADANCRGVDADLFFPVPGETSSQAKAVCAGCEVRAECLDYALRHDLRYGVWGGLTKEDRKAVRRVDYLEARRRRRQRPNGAFGHVTDAYITVLLAGPGATS
jgi:WhiB family redox-sensing transcriptional regulator